MIFGPHLPAYTSCLVAATGAAALVGADGVSIAEYQGEKNKQNQLTTFSSQWRIQGRVPGEPGPPHPPPPSTSQCQGLHSVQKRDLSLSFLVLPQHE